MTHRLALRAATALGFAAALSIARVAAAQDAAAAEALFKQGRELMTKGDLEAACPKLAESERLDPSSGTALNLALCHKKQGKTATAWADYKNAARVAQRQGNAARVEEANREAADLEKSLAYLTIEVASPVAGLEVLRDDVKLEAGSFGAKLPVDPGKHVVVAKAAGYKAVTLDVSIDGPGAAQALTVPALEKNASESDVSLSTTRPPAHGTPTWAWILGGTGVAVTGAAVGLGIASISAGNAWRSTCGGDACTGLTPQQQVQVTSQSGKENTFAILGSVLGGVGAVAIGFSIYGIASSPKASPGPQARFVLSPTSGRWEGTF